MRKKSNILIRSCSVILLLIGLINNAYTQSPYISNISSTAGAVGDTISISGINFSTTLANNKVRFGAAEGTVIEATDKLLLVTVPSGASTDVVSVLNTSNGLYGYSSEVFHLSFGGAGFSASRTNTFSSQSTGGVVTQDLCACDFDGDGLIDIANTNLESTFFNIYENESTVDNVVLTKITDINLGFESFNITCGDLNGDQLPDLVISRSEANGDRIVYLVNNSTPGNIQFGSANVLNFTGTQPNPGNVVISDVNLDGKPEIVMVARAEGTIKIFKNTTTGGTLSFDSTPTSLDIGVILAGMDVKDLNNDGLPDIAISSDKQSNFYVLQNSSDPNAGTIVFEDPKAFNRSGVQELKLGDINQDGFNDIVLSAPNRDDIFVYPNTTTGIGEEINFGTNNILTGVNGPWGIDLVDIDGDSDLDVISTIINGATDNLYVFENTTPGTLGFADAVALTSASNGNSRNVTGVDIDGDARPDLVFTHKSNTAVNGELAVMLNDNCFAPSINGPTDLTVCTGGNITLNTTNSLGFNYQWYKDANPIAGATNSSYTISGASAASHDGAYTVAISNDLCGQQSAAVNITVSGTAFATTGIDATTPFCQDSELSLNTTQTGVSYLWTGPDGTTYTTQNPTISSSANASHAGIYTLVMTDLTEGCISQTYSETVEVINVPTIVVNNNDGDVFCTNSSIQLSLTDFGSGYTYAWKKDGSAFDNGTDDPSSTSQTITESGNYSGTISVTDGGKTCTIESTARRVDAIAPPTPSFTGDSEKCVDVAIDFTVTSTGFADSVITHTWNFGDGSADVINNTLSHAYNSSGSFTVTLTANYQYVNKCENTTVQQSQTISDVPTGAATDLLRSGNADPTNLEKCPSGTLTLTVADGPNGGYDPNGYDWQTYDAVNTRWNTRENTSSDTQGINVSSEDSIRVGLTDVVGCMFFTPGDSIKNLANSGIALDIQAPNQFGTNADTIASLGRYVPLQVDQKFVTLTTDATSPTWNVPNHSADADKVFDNVNGTTVEAYPSRTVEFIQVTGTDSQGCIESDSVTLTNNRIRADKNFSPNGDGIGDAWTISNSSSADFAGCTISIFDAKGSLVLRQSGPFTEDQVWDGNKQGGGALPEGIYYYVLNCSDSSLESAGSILLAR